MCQIEKEREHKRTCILDAYNQRKSHNDIAQLYKMDPDDVGIVTRMMGFSHTRKLSPGNVKYREPITDIAKYEFLDKYPIDNFPKI